MTLVCTSPEVFSPYFADYQPFPLSAGKINLNSVKVMSHVSGNNV